MSSLTPMGPPPRCSIPPQFKQLCENTDGKTPQEYADLIYEKDHWGGEIETFLFAVVCHRVVLIGDAEVDALGNKIFVPRLQMTPPGYNFSFYKPPYRFVHDTNHYNVFEEAVPAVAFHIERCASKDRTATGTGRILLHGCFLLRGTPSPRPAARVIHSRGA